MPTPPLGNPNQIDASNIDIDLPMGRPGGTLEEEDEGTLEDDEEIGDEFKQLVTKLVRQGKLSLYCVLSLLCISCALFDIGVSIANVSLTLIPSFPLISQ